MVNKLFLQVISDEEKKSVVQKNPWHIFTVFFRY